MSTNYELAERFEEMASLLELTGANAFRINAHTRVARALESHSADIATLVDTPKSIESIDGIGASSVKKIIEFITTGEISDLNELRAQVPDGLIEVLRVPGLGPKTVRKIWTELGVESIEQLKTAIDDGSLESLPRMGAKTIANIREAITFMESSGGRERIGTAMPIAERIVESLHSIPGVQRIEYAGSLRRGKETIGDIDILISSTQPEDAHAAFRAMDGVTKVLVSGASKSSVRTDDGLQIDLRVVDDNEFGAALLYFTGSKEHNVLLRERAIAKNLRLNEYGLFPNDGKDESPQSRGISPVASSTEEEIYTALDLQWIPPELREDRGELDTPPPSDLITVNDICAELHSHTTASDGRLSITELAETARSEGRTILAVTDHSQSSAQAGGLDPDRLRKHAAEVREVNEHIEGITLLAGSEVDIHADGSLDYEDDILAMLDIVVASPHASLRQDPETATKRLCAAASHPLVSIIGHPTGRLINDRKGLEPDIEKLCEAAIEGHTALEINSNPWRLDLRDIHVRTAMDAGALISINTDVHRAEHFQYVRYGVLTGRRGRLRKESCINTWPIDQLRKWLNRGN